MSTSPLPPGSRIGKYEIVAHIATGGMGAVYKARDAKLRRIVALKLLPPDMAQNPVLVERFRREAGHAARLSHKNIVALFECGHADGHHYLALEFVEGLDLAEYIRLRGKLDTDEARRILKQACKALEHAFAQGITHRDIKPSNFLLAVGPGRCRVKLADLGLARMVNDDEFRVTRSGTTVGTVDYMAPEQARDSSLADIRSDIYSLGCTFYHMLAGQPPFSEGGVGQRIYQHLAANPPDVRTHNPNVSAALWTILRRMLAKNPDDRFQTPTELLDALRAMSGAVILPRPPAGEDDPASDPEAIGEAASPPDERARPAPAPPPPAPPPPRRPAPVEKPAEPRKKRRTSLPDQSTLAEAPPDRLGVTAEQRSTAAAQFARATEVIKTGGDLAYALQLLLSTCKLDPSNPLYRKLLREVGRDVAGRKRAGWLGSLTSLPARGRVRAARRAGDHRKVLELGEELLARAPGDVSTQIEMAESAEALGMEGLAAWMLEEARGQAPKNKSVLRALALIYERQKRFGQAIPVWEEIRKIDPTDLDVSTRIKDLSARDTISRGNFHS